MRIFLTGATGFIGRHVLAALGTEHEIVALTTHAYALSPFPHVSFAQGNLLRGGEAERLFERFPADTLLHLAWHVPPGAFWDSPSNMNWLAASLSLARAFVEQGGTRMVFAGSGAEYDWNSPMPLKEGLSPLKPRFFYGVCKNSLRQVVEAYAASAGVSCLWCRIFWPYGPGEAPEKFLSSIMGALSRGEYAVCRGANLKRDYIYVEDVAHALAMATTSPLNGVLNIGRGKAVSLGQIARLAAAAMGRPELLKLESAEISEAVPEIIMASAERLSRELGWRPRYSLVEGISAMAEAAMVAGEGREDEKIFGRGILEGQKGFSDRSYRI